MKNTFDKAKQKNRLKRKEFKVRFKFFGEEFYVNPFLIPVAFVVGTAEYISKKYYESLKWSEAKAEKLLDKTLPKVLKWVEEDNAYYYCMNWRVWYLTDKVSIFHRKWAEKFVDELMDYLENDYHHPKYRKLKEEDEWGDKWLKFEEYPEI